ncbi:EF-hand domain-containing protein, partial [Pseudoalteromonas piscicida]|uniref:EF-hand domain-containing protein n=4 Tax=Pseudoalteromonas TaxID=53246 RepID=UPI00110B25A0
MKNVLIALSITGLSFASVNAMAGEDFAALDTDQSGTISMSEAQAHTALAEQFKALD